MLLLLIALSNKEHIKWHGVPHLSQVMEFEHYNQNAFLGSAGESQLPK